MMITTNIFLPTLVMIISSDDCWLNTNLTKNAFMVKKDTRVSFAIEMLVSTLYGGVLS